MTALDSAPVPLAFATPPGIAPRGTVLVVPGRGETPETYQRLGARLAADAWVVRVVADPVVDPAVTLAQLAAASTDAVSPVVLLGSDTGALFAADHAAVGPVDGLVLAGLPGPGDVAQVGDWDGELDLRTSCPTHRARLSAGAVRPTALGEPVPADWAPVDLTALGVPVLALHGEVDRVSPLAAARTRYAGAELAVVHGARHDVLNDQTHRSVAATVVLFLERLRAGHPIVDVEAPRG